jgi:hypothetical protein
MNIVPPTRRPKQIRLTTKPKALVATAACIFWLLVCAGALSLGCSFAVGIPLFSVQTVLITVAVCLCRFERPHEVRFRGDFPQPPVIHGT